MQVCPRSDLTLRHKLMLPNSPGTIDSDYRGELQIIVLNAGSEPVRIERGMKIAQLVLHPVPASPGANARSWTRRSAAKAASARRGRGRGRERLNGCSGVAAYCGLFTIF